MELKSLARAHSAFDGAVTFWMMPFSTIGVSAAFDRMKIQIPSDDPGNEWGDTRWVFVQAVHVTVDIEFPDEAEGDIAFLQAFWQGGNGRSFEQFSMMPEKVLTEWWNSYKATRDDSLDAPDPEAPTVSEESANAGGS